MNLIKSTTSNERELLSNIGINIENREYTKDELKNMESSIVDFIMNHSTKNNDINKYNNLYNEILDKIYRII